MKLKKMVRQISQDTRVLRILMRAVLRNMRNQQVPREHPLPSLERIEYDHQVRPIARQMLGNCTFNTVITKGVTVVVVLEPRDTYFGVARQNPVDEFSVEKGLRLACADLRRRNPHWRPRQ